MIKNLNDKRQTTKLFNLADDFLRIYSRVAYNLLVLMVCFLSLVLWCSMSRINTYERDILSTMVYGTAWKPFVYRTLLFSLVRVITPYVPLQPLEAIRSVPILENLLVRLQVETYPREALLTLAGMYLSLIGFYFALRYLAEGTGWTRKQAARIALIGVGLSFLMGYNGRLYDQLQWFLFTLALALLAHKDWWLYLAVFALACFSKETAILLLLVYRFAIPRWYRSTHLVVLQLVIYILVKGLLTWAFWNNPGGIVEYHLPQQIRTVIMWPWLAVASLILCGLITYLVKWSWSYKPLFLRRSLVILPPMLVLFWLFGFPYEVRTFMEVYPIVFLLALPAWSANVHPE